MDIIMRTEHEFETCVKYVTHLHNTTGQFKDIASTVLLVRIVYFTREGSKVLHTYPFAGIIRRIFFFF